MKGKQFDKLGRELFAGVLGEYGFTCERSRHCTFYRQITEDIYHVVLPDLGSRGAWYDVKVFPASPVLDRRFHEIFPNELGIPSDSYCYLSEQGVGFRQQTYNCKYEDNMRRRFEKTVKKVLLEHAIPYVNRFHSIEDMIPVLKSPRHLAIGLYHVGRRDEAFPLLKDVKEFLSGLDTSNPVVAVPLAHVTELLESY